MKITVDNLTIDTSGMVNYKTSQVLKDLSTEQKEAVCSLLAAYSEKMYESLKCGEYYNAGYAQAVSDMKEHLNNFPINFSKKRGKK